jgi:hypothetical protein
MNPSSNLPDPELDVIFALARSRRPDTSAAEFAFETRLIARLRARREDHSAWATVSWRLLPFFAACIVALTFWQAEVSSDANDAAAVATLTNPVAADLGSD